MFQNEYIRGSQGSHRRNTYPVLGVPLLGTSELRPAAGRGIREVKNPMCKGLCCRVCPLNRKLPAGSEVEGGNECTCKTQETGKDGSHEMCLAL